MKALRTFLTCVLVTLSSVSLLCSCGSSGSPPPTENPVPVIQAISPSSAAAGANGFTLTVTGSSFVSSSTLSWNGTAKQATIVGSSEIKVAISSADLAASGTVPVTVSNPAPGGGQASANFAVSPPGSPTLTSISPTALAVGTGPASLTVTGNNFVLNSVVQWNGSNRPTTYLSNTQLTVSIPASDLTMPMSVAVNVVTPSPGGGNSNSVPVAVQYPAPAINSLSPTQVVLGGPAFTLTVNGSNFVSGATVYWNNASRATQFVNSIQLTAAILASDLALASPNSASITVQNPSPAIGVSNAISLVLANPVPQIISVSPTSALAGVIVSITVTGSGFVPGATVQLGSQTFPTNTLMPSMLSAQVTATVGSLNLSVSNPSPTSGPSNGETFTGIAAGPGANIVPVSIDPSGKILDGINAPGKGVISSSGRYYAFNEDISAGYVRDTCLGTPTGCQPSTTEYPLANAISCSTLDLYTQSVSMNGESVAYSWFCLSDTNLANLMLADTCLGVSNGCTQSAKQIVSSVVYTDAFLVPSGHYIAYGVGGAPAGSNFQGDLYDTCIGAPSGCSPTSIPVTSAFGISVPVPSSDGRFSVYGETQFPGAPSSFQVNLHDSCLGAATGCTPSDTAVSATGCHLPSIASDAQYIVYACDGNPSPIGIFLQATCLGMQMGCSTSPAQVTTPFPPPFQSPPLVSAGGRWVVFSGHGATIMGQQVTNTVVFVYDSCNGAAAGCLKQTVP